MSPLRVAGRAVQAACIATLLGLGAACSRAPSDPVERATQAVSADRIGAVGRVLSSDDMAGRFYASPEADSAAAYIQRRLTAAGAPPAQHSESLLGGHAASFAHHFSVTLYRLGPHTRLSAPRAGHERAAELGRDFLPLVFSRESEVVGKVVWVQSRLDQLRDPDRSALRNRIAVIEAANLLPSPGLSRDAMLYRTARRLEELGATAVLFSDDVALQHAGGATYPSTLSPLLMSVVHSTRGELLNVTADRLCLAAQARAWRDAPRRIIPAMVVRASWANRLQSGEDVALGIDLVPEVSLGENVLAGFRGTVHPNEVVVLAAHYDHTGVNAAGDVLNGANDNASGTAALLELAQALGQVSRQLQRSVLLCFFSAYNEGLQGSESLLEDLRRLLGPAVRPVAMLGLRAVGRNGHRPLLLVGGTESPALAELLERYNHRELLLGTPLVLQRLSNEVPAGASTPLDAAAGRASDHLTFARLGIPNLLINDGLEADLYGHPEDDWRYVDADKVARVTRLVFRATLDLATDLRPTALPASSRH